MTRSIMASQKLDTPSNFIFLICLTSGKRRWKDRLNSRLPERSTYCMKDCPDINELTRYLEHKASPDETARLEAHFVECRTCRKIVARVMKSESVIADP